MFTLRTSVCVPQSFIKHCFETVMFGDKRKHPSVSVALPLSVCCMHICVLYACIYVLVLDQVEQVHAYGD